MIKGNERRVVVLKGDKSSEYDVAYVFMKDGKRAVGEGESIVSEAERIISKSYESVGNKQKKEKHSFASRFLFFAGAISGSAITLIICFAIQFISK